MFVGGLGGSSGQFGITAFETLSTFAPTAAPLPLSYSEGCLAGADTLAVDGITVLGSTLGAPTYLGGTCFGFITVDDSPGVVFRVVGTGNSITVDTCNINTNFDTWVSSIWTHGLQWEPSLVPFDCIGYALVMGGSHSCC